MKLQFKALVALLGHITPSRPGGAVAISPRRATPPEKIVYTLKTSYHHGAKIVESLKSPSPAS